LAVGLLSGRPSPATTRRAEELGITLVVQDGGGSKRRAFDRILADRGLSGDDVAYMGDDLLDLPILAIAGLATAPSDAAPEVIQSAHWVSRHPGGRGAVRELVEVVLRARGRWEAWVAHVGGEAG
jgi:3-deoxy-D-manno-octulosonate 8-phosphate phosphatase (KDO 8-P phosphatase)